MATTHTFREQIVRPSAHWGGVVLALVAGIWLLPAAAEAREVPRESASDSIGRIVKSARHVGADRNGDEQRQGRGPRVARRLDGRLRGLIAGPSRHFPVSSAVPGDAQATAGSFLDEYKSAFGTADARLGRVPEGVKERARRRHVRFAQTCAGIPVFAAQTIVQLDEAGGVQYVSNDTMTDEEALGLDDAWAVPLLGRTEAEHIAIGVLTEEEPGLEFQAEPATLMVYQPSIVGNTGPARLVWHTQVASVPEPVVVERVLVDARDGSIALRCSVVNNALCRVIYDCCNSQTGYPRRSEGMPPYIWVPDVDRAYDYLGDAYTFYHDFHGRDSIDNAGMCLVAFVRVCFANKPCPWANAAWVGGGYNYFVFGAGFVADDVVAHEYTHGVTEFESGLLYMNESGAICESFSDMWGEWVDQTNGRGTDTDAVKWLIGEDTPGGAIRNMKNPAAWPYYHADRKGSENWRSLPAYILPVRENDYGYIHNNCGVNNKLCYLLTDGGTFNGYQIAPMGIAKVGALYYEVQTELLTQAADYDDLYLALVDAALILGWTEADRDNLEAACSAVEIAVWDQW